MFWAIRAQKRGITEYSRSDEGINKAGYYWRKRSAPLINAGYYHIHHQCNVHHGYYGYYSGYYGYYTGYYGYYTGYYTG